jgi:hypothetical protein
MCLIPNCSERAHRSRNFNDFAADVNASAIPQWLFVTPNMVNDGHGMCSRCSDFVLLFSFVLLDTSAAFFSNWTTYWLLPLLADPRFNGELSQAARGVDNIDNVSF